VQLLPVRGQHGSVAKLARHHATPERRGPARRSSHDPWETPATTTRESAGTVLIASGDATVNGNDFASEAACIRKAPSQRVAVIERTNIEIAELRREIERHRPTVVHLAAHADMGLIHLSTDGAPTAVRPADITHVIRSATHQRHTVVFNCCDSEQLARQMVLREHQLSTGGMLAIGWRGDVTDEQARTFASLLYRAFDGPHSILVAFDDLSRPSAARSR
jgi:hypothetical protein